MTQDWNDTFAQMREAAGKASAEEKMLRDLLGFLPFPMFVKSYRKEPATYLYVNPAFESLIDRSASNIVGKSDYDLWTRQFADRARVEDVETLETSKWNRTHPRSYLPFKGAIDTIVLFPIRYRLGGIVVMV